MTQRRAYLATLAGALGISTAPVLYALADVHPTTGAVWRFLYALPLLAALGFARGRGDFANRAWLPWALGSGLLFAADMSLWHHSVVLIGAGPGTLLVNTQVLWVALFGLLFLGERPSLMFWLALPAAFAGMFLIAGGDLGGIADARDRSGLLAALLASFCYAGFLITLRRAQRVATVAPALTLLVQVGVACAVLSGLGFIEGSLPVSLTGSQHGWLLLLGIGPQVVAWLLITAGLRELPGHHGAVLLIAQPVGSLLLGWWILDQALSIPRVLGAALIVAAILLAVLPASRSSTVSGDGEAA